MRTDPGVHALHVPPALARDPPMSATSLLLLQLIVILGIARVCGWLLRHVGQPAVVGEMEARVVLGPIVLGGLFQTLFGGAVDTQLAPADSQCRIKPAECRARRGHRPGPPARKRAFEFPIPSGHSEILASRPPAGLDDARQPLPARIMFSGPHNRPSASWNPGPVHGMMLMLMPDALRLLFRSAMAISMKSGRRWEGPPRWT
jgi:hypothetical protein